MIEDIHAAVRAILSEETARACPRCGSLRAQIGALCAAIASWREKALRACDYDSNRVDCPRCGSRSPWGDICGECEAVARVAAAFEAEIEELRATIAQLTTERAEPAPPDDLQAAEREAETRLDAMRATIARLTRERDAAETALAALTAEANHGQSPEEAQQELAADGVDVPAFLARVGQACFFTGAHAGRLCFCVQCMGKSPKPR